MQLLKTLMDGSSLFVLELAPQASHADLITTAIDTSLENEGCNVLIGENLTANQQRGEIGQQIFHVFASNGVLIATNLVP